MRILFYLLSQKAITAAACLKEVNIKASTLLEIPMQICTWCAHGNMKRSRVASRVRALRGKQRRARRITFASLGARWMGFNRYHQNLFSGTSAGVISQYYTWHSTFPASANKLFSVKGRSLPIQRAFRIFRLPRPEVVFVTHNLSLSLACLFAPTLSFLIGLGAPGCNAPLYSLPFQDAHT